MAFTSWKTRAWPETSSYSEQSKILIQLWHTNPEGPATHWPYSLSYPSLRDFVEETPGCSLQHWTDCFCCSLCPVAFPTYKILTSPSLSPGTVYGRRPLRTPQPHLCSCIDVGITYVLELHIWLFFLCVCLPYSKLCKSKTFSSSPWCP